MRVLFGVSFVHQDINNPRRVHSTTWMVEGDDDWGKDKVLDTARYQIKYESDSIIPEGFTEVLASYSRAEIGVVLAL